MAPFSLFRLIAICITFLAVTFTLFITFCELPKRSADPITFMRAPPVPVPVPLTVVREAKNDKNSMPISIVNPVETNLNEEKTSLNHVDAKTTLYSKITLLNSPDEPIGGDAVKDKVINDLEEERIREELVREDPTWVSWEKMNRVRYLSLLTGASIASSVICHPLHVIMMRQQVGAMSATGGFFGVFGSIKEAYDTLGIQGLFRGWVPLMLEAPSHALYFSVTESSREYLQSFLRKKFTFFDYNIKISSLLVDILQSMISAFIANSISLIPWVPAEILSAKLAIQTRKNAVGMNAMIVQIYKKDGFSGFFKGFFSSLTVHVTYSFLWWVSYTTTRRQVSYFFPNMQEENIFVYDAITGILAGLASGVVNHPLDTIKMRIQTATDEQETEDNSKDDDNNHDYIKDHNSKDEYNRSCNNNCNTSSIKDHCEGSNGIYTDKGNGNHNGNHNHIINVSDQTNSNHDQDLFKISSRGSNDNDTLPAFLNNPEFSGKSEKHQKHQPVSMNLISMGTLIIREEGITALFSGLYASMYSTIFSSASFCIIYEMIKRQSLITQKR